MYTLDEIWNTPESKLVEKYGKNTNLRGEDLRILVAEDYYENDFLNREDANEYTRSIMQEKLRKMKIRRTIEFVKEIGTFGDLLDLSVGTLEGYFLPIFSNPPYESKIPADLIDTFIKLSKNVFVDSFVETENYTSLSFWINSSRLIYITDLLHYSKEFKVLITDKTKNNFDQISSFVRPEFIRIDPELPEIKKELFENLTNCVISSDSLNNLPNYLLNILNVLNE